MGILTGNVYTDIFAGVATLLAVAIVYFKWSFGYWSRKNVVTPPVVIPFGTAKDVFLQKASIGELSDKSYKTFKAKGFRYYGGYVLTKPQLVVLDLDLVKSILTKDFLHFTDHINYVNEKVDPLSGHLFSLKGLKWKNLRAKLTPTFTSGKMKMMFQTLLDCSDELTVLMDEMVGKCKDIDIKEVVSRFTTDVIGSCAFGIDCNSLKNPDSEFRKYGKRVFTDSAFEAFKTVVAVFLPGVLDFFQEPLNKRDVTKFFMNIVKETVDYREKNNVVRKDFMHLLIQLKNNVKIRDEESTGQLTLEGKAAESEVGKSLTVDELAAQAFVFFLAGFETSSTTLTFCFCELVSNVEIQNKLRDEINSVLKKHEGKLTYNAIMEMTYMEKCINETLRKYPAIPILTRECTQAYQLPDSDVKLEKGAQIIIPVLAIQRDPEHYPDPDKFDPERFSPESKSQRHPYAWLPFGEGPRACIGLRFGIMQAKVALAILLKGYRFTLSPKTDTPLIMDPKSLILNALKGIWLNAEKIY